MTAPRGFKVADFDMEPGDYNHFCVATINWSEPKPWSEEGKAPIDDAEDPNAVYAITRDHHRQSNRGTIVYIGMTKNLPTRFAQHHKADEIRKKRGTLLSVGQVTYSSTHSRWARNNPSDALHQIEHILIWALWPTLMNEKSQFSLPLLSGKGIAKAKPWIIRREGHKFHGRMPIEIAYPWMIIKPGRDRSARK